MKPDDELANQPSYKNYLQADSEKKSELNGGQNKRMLKGGLNTKAAQIAAAAATAVATASSKNQLSTVPPSSTSPLSTSSLQQSETGQPETLSTATAVDAMGATAMDVRPEQNDEAVSNAELKNATTFYRDELLKLVVTRNNVGEFMWYVYTGILVISIIQYYILTRGCVSDAATMEKNYQKFLENEDAIQAQQDAGQNTTYTVSS